MIGNTASGHAGGIAVLGGTPILLNNLVARNEAGGVGGGMVYYRAGGAIGACTVADNTAGVGAGGIQCGSCSPLIGNCILWGNTPVDLLGNSALFSDVGTGVTAGTGNISQDPAFVDGGLGAEYGYYDLSSGSPCIGAAYSGPLAPAIDIEGNPRSAPYDMGAYEY